MLTLGFKLLLSAREGVSTSWQAFMQTGWQKKTVCRCLATSVASLTRHRRRPGARSRAYLVRAVAACLPSLHWRLAPGGGHLPPAAASPAEAARQALANGCAGSEWPSGLVATAAAGQQLQVGQGPTQRPQVHQGQAAVAADQAGRPADRQQLRDACESAKRQRCSAIRGGGCLWHAIDSLAGIAALCAPMLVPAGALTASGEGRSCSWQQASWAVCTPQITKPAFLHSAPPEISGGKRNAYWMLTNSSQ